MALISQTVLSQKSHGGIFSKLGNCSDKSVSWLQNKKNVGFFFLSQQKKCTKFHFEIMRMSEQYHLNVNLPNTTEQHLIFYLWFWPESSFLRRQTSANLGCLVLQGWRTQESSLNRRPNFIEQEKVYKEIDRHTQQKVIPTGNKAQTKSHGWVIQKWNNPQNVQDPRMGQKPSKNKEWTRLNQAESKGSPMATSKETQCLEVNMGHT